MHIMHFKAEWNEMDEKHLLWIDTVVRPDNKDLTFSDPNEA